MFIIITKFITSSFQNVNEIHEYLRIMFSNSWLNSSHSFNYTKNKYFSLRYFPPPPPSDVDCSCNYFDIADETTCFSNGLSTKPRCGCRAWIENSEPFCYVRSNCPLASSSSFVLNAQYMLCDINLTPPPPPAYPLDLTCDDPNFADQWHHKYVHSFDVWSVQNVSGNGISVVVVDTGVETHSDFVISTSDSYESFFSGTLPPPTNPHGTNCAGVIAAIRNNQIGGCGVSYNSKIIDAPLLSSFSHAFFEDIYTRFENRSDIIFSNSWGPEEYSSYALNDVQQKIMDESVWKRNGRGLILIWAAGNGQIWDNVNDDAYNSHVSTITVTASSEMMYRTWYAEFGSCIDVTAPSAGTLGLDGIFTTTTSNSHTESFGGTSAATPIVSGIVALMLEKNQNLSYHDIRQILWRSSFVIDSSKGMWITNARGYKYSPIYGYGMVNALKVFEILSNYSLLENTHNYHKLVLDNVHVGSILTNSWTVSSCSTLYDTFLESVEIFINITDVSGKNYNWKGDLDISLQSPQGTISPLTYFISRSFYTTNSLSSRFRSRSFLVQSFFNESSYGTWKLYTKSAHTDNVDIPVLNSFQITLHGHTSYGTTSIIQDPHVTFSNGEKSDLRGGNLLYYSLFADRHHFVNAKFEESIFKLRDKFVNGSFVTKAYVGLPNDGFFQISPNRTCGWRCMSFSCHGKEKAHHLFFGRQKKCPGFFIKRNYASVKISTKTLRILIYVQPIYGLILGPHRRLDIYISYKGHERPTGILGQSFRSYFRCNKTSFDSYSTQYVVTRSQAEGCIRGNLSDYGVSYFKKKVF